MIRVEPLGHRHPVAPPDLWEPSEDQELRFMYSAVVAQAIAHPSSNDFSNTRVISICQTRSWYQGLATAHRPLLSRSTPLARVGIIWRPSPRLGMPLDWRVETVHLQARLVGCLPRPWSTGQIFDGGLHCSTTDDVPATVTIFPARHRAPSQATANSTPRR